MVNYARHALAFFMAFLIFSLGLVSGIAMDYARRSWAREEIERSFVDAESLQVQALLMENEENCMLVKVSLDNAVRELGKNLEKIKRYERDGRVTLDPENVLWRKYMLANVRYWFIARKYKKVCHDNSTVLILYFYSYSSCEKCPAQGAILSYYKKKFGDRLLIFPLNMEVNEPTLHMLANFYNITSYPAVVIEGEVYRRFLSKDELGGILCERGLC